MVTSPKLGRAAPPSKAIRPDRVVVDGATIAVSVPGCALNDTPDSTCCPSTFSHNWRACNAPRSALAGAETGSGWAAGATSGRGNLLVGASSCGRGSGRCGISLCMAPVTRPRRSFPLVCGGCSHSCCGSGSFGDGGGGGGGGAGRLGGGPA